MLRRGMKELVCNDGAASIKASCAENPVCRPEVVLGYELDQKPPRRVSPTTAAFYTGLASHCR